MDNNTIAAFIGAFLTIIFTTSLGVSGYLIRSLIRSLVTEVHELKGELKPVNQNLKENTIELVKVRSELNAVWRYIDDRKNKE